MINIYVTGGGDTYDPLNTHLSFYVVERNELTSRRYLLRFENGSTRLDEVEEGDVTPDPTFVLAADKGQEFLKALAELAYARGIRLKSDETRQGKLEATEKHLEDMRRIVFQQP